MGTLIAPSNHISWIKMPEMLQVNGHSEKQLNKFKKRLEEKYAVEFGDYFDFHEWSLEHLEEFWKEVWDFFGIICSKSYHQVIDKTVPLQNVPKWFEGAKLNFAENLLKFRDQHIALIVTGEENKVEFLTYTQMFEEVRLYAAALRRFGLKKGDRTVCYMSNRKEAVLAMMAVTSIGAIWAACNPLLGGQAAANRFGQIEPKVLFTVDMFPQDKEVKEILDKVKHLANGISSLEKVVIVPSNAMSKTKDISGIRNSCFLDEFLETGRKEDGSVPPLQFEQVSFSHPVFIDYTSGTTGLPKCLIHGSGVILSLCRDFGLHTNTSRDDVWLSTSPAGWPSWTFLSTLHFIGSTILLYEGVPFFQSPTYFWDLIDRFDITSMILLPSSLDRFEKSGYTPTQKHSLRSLKVIITAGAVLLERNYTFVKKKIKQELLLSNGYGSTEIMSFCLMCDTTLQENGTEIPSPCLATDIRCFDEKGNPVEGEVGELFISNPTPSLPIGIWNDSNGSIYKKTYFSKLAGKFAMGDLAVRDRITKGFTIHQRSDETVRCKNWRFGTSEIYNVVNTIPEVRDSVCACQYNKDKEVRVVLFVTMSNGYPFSERLVKKIRNTITKDLTPDHVPEIILEASDIPYNVSGKKMEMLVKKIINGIPYNTETVFNPECLPSFHNIPQLNGF